MTPDADAPDLAGLTVPDLTDEDVHEAMREFHGYLDITPGDFRELYRLAFRQALKRLCQGVTAARVMTREVAAVTVATPVQAVAHIMGSRGVSGVPVLDEAGRVAGVISERDFLGRLGVGEPQKFMHLLAECLKTRKCLALPLKENTAADLMSSPAVTVAPDTPVAEISALFNAKGINRVPVVDAAGHLVGIVSRADLVNLLFPGGQACLAPSSAK